MQEKINFTLIINIMVGLISIGKTFKITIILAPAQIVVRTITFYWNADIATKLNVINVMNMDIRPDCVPMVHSNQ